MIGCAQAEFPEIGWLDAYAERLGLDAAVRRIMDFAPDVVAVSAYTTQIHEAADTARALKKAGSNAKIIVGGPHTSKLPVGTALEFPEFDYVAAGEGEAMIIGFLRALRDGAPAENIPGIYRLRGGEVLSGGECAYIEDLDSLPFPEWRHVNWDSHCAIFTLRGERMRETAVWVNRGCPFNCIFCAKIMGNKVRKRSLAAVVEQVKRDVADYGARQVLFTDETVSDGRPMM